VKILLKMVFIFRFFLRTSERHFGTWPSLQHHQLSLLLCKHLSLQNFGNNLI
jgi:hypothetical protein